MSEQEIEQQLEAIQRRIDQVNQKLEAYLTGQWPQDGGYTGPITPEPSRREMLRDHYAGLAMQALIARGDINKTEAEAVSNDAFTYAYEMLKTYDLLTTPPHHP